MSRDLHFQDIRDSRSANLDKYLVKPSKIQTKAKIKLPEVPNTWRNKKRRIPI